jgi:signal transduction histidine kinase
MTNLASSLTNALQFAREEFRARMSPFDLEEMLGGLVRYYRDIGMGTAVEEYAAGFPKRIIGDTELLYQVFSNLLSNAFKYSGQESTVQLTANAKDGAVEIIVEDRGVGIPHDELGRIKERYYRAANVGTIPGTGMGLYLADEIIRQHDGRLDIESEEGKGTRVSVMLPVGHPSEPAID